MTSDFNSSPSAPEPPLSDRTPDPSPTTPQYTTHDFTMPAKTSLWVLSLAGIGLLLTGIWVFRYNTHRFAGTVASLTSSNSLTHFSNPASGPAKTSEPPAPVSKPLNSPVDISADTSAADSAPAVPLLALIDQTPNIPREPITMQRFLEDPKIVQVQEKLDQLTLAVDTFNEALDTQQKSWKVRFNKLTTQLQAVQKAFVGSGSTEGRVKAPEAIPRAGALSRSSNRAGGSREPGLSQQPSVKIALPFELVSIDQWGETTDVVVRYRGNLINLTPEHPLGSWRLAAIDAGENQITVVNTQGQRVVLAQPKR